MQNMEITCNDCYAYGDTHSSCLKARFGEVDKKSPACKDIKYIKTCKRDCYAYGDTHSSCHKVRAFEVDEKSFACEKIKLRKETVELLKAIKGEVIAAKEQESTQDNKSKTYKLENK